MLGATLLDELLVITAVFLLFAEIYALGMAYQLYRSLVGNDGASMVKIVLRFGLIVVIAQMLTVANTVLRVIDYIEFADIRLLMFLGTEVLFGVGFIWMVWKIHHLPANRYPDNPSVEWSETPERIGEQVNHPVTTASTGINEPDTNTPVAPI